jgi:hypothetical protein
MAQTISLMEPAQAQIRPKAFEMSINKEGPTGTNLAFPTLSVALAWMFDVPEAGADCMFSIEERISRGDRNTASANRRSDAKSKPESLPDAVRAREGGGGCDRKASSSSKVPLGSKCTLCCKGSWQPIDIATNATALRAHHKPTFGVEIAHASHKLIAHERRLLADCEDATERVRLWLQISEL